MILNPNGGILTSEIFCNPRKALIGDTNQHKAKQINQSIPEFVEKQKANQN